MRDDHTNKQVEKMPNPNPEPITPVLYAYYTEINCHGATLFAPAEDETGEHWIASTVAVPVNR